MIEEFIINNLSVKPEIIYSSIKYDIKERPAGCFKYSNGVEFIFVISNM